MTSSVSSLVFGLDTFGDLDHEQGRPVSHAQTIRNVVEQGVLAEEVGIDFFGIGEHHTEDFPMPAGDAGRRCRPAMSCWPPSRHGRRASVSDPQSVF